MTNLGLVKRQGGICPFNHFPLKHIAGNFYAIKSILYQTHAHIFFKGTVQRDFEPPVVFTILTSLDH